VGQPVDPVQDGSQELVQGGEVELRLGLDRPRPQDPQVGGLLDRVLEQRRLPGTSLAAEDEHPAPRRPRAVDERRDDRALGVPTVKHPPSLEGRPTRPGTKTSEEPEATVYALASREPR
jgi:hypothetical protein